MRKDDDQRAWSQPAGEERGRQQRRFPLSHRLLGRTASRSLARRRRPDRALTAEPVRTPLLATGASVLALPVLAVVVFFGSGAADPPAASMTCSVVSDPAAAATVLGSDTIQVTAEQTANARVIVAAAKTLGMPQEASAVGIMAAYQESRLLVLANPTVPESLAYAHQGVGSDRDSLGTFQQRPSQGWGTVAQLMDPGYAAVAFLGRLAEVPSWQRLPLWQAAQAVQHSADGTMYMQWEPLATAVTAALWLGADGSLNCTNGGVPATGSGGPFPPEACSVVPDPTTGRGCLTPRMLNVASQLLAQGWSISCWDAHEWNPTSDHPLGQACDVFPGRAGVLPSAQQQARGDDLAASLQGSAAQTGVSYVIWYGRIWSVGRATEGWRPYNGGGVYDPASITGGHYDHVHISVY